MIQQCIECGMVFRFNQNNFDQPLPVSYCSCGGLLLKGLIPPSPPPASRLPLIDDDEIERVKQRIMQRLMQRISEEEIDKIERRKRNKQNMTGILLGIGLITFLAIVIGIQTTIMISIGVTGILITIGFNA